MFVNKTIRYIHIYISGILINYDDSFTSFRIRKMVANCKEIENNDFSKLTVYFMKHDNVS